MAGSFENRRVFIVTGANTGIGYAVAEQLAALEHAVIVVSRDARKGDAAVEAIRTATGNNAVELVQGDLSSIAGVRDLAARLLERCPRIDALINNAGIWPTRRELNPDGYEMAFMVNHLAPFLLSHLLLDRLQASAPARIVNVNAGLFVKGEVDLDKLPTGENFHRFKTYMHTKLCNVYFTLEMAKRLEGSGVTVNALHPGVIRTQLGDSRGFVGLLVKFVKRFWSTPQEGARPVVHLATDPIFEETTGKYYNVEEEFEIPANAKDPKIAQALWDFSAESTGVGA
jgi:NAD(P)-dependent dehydrogenase (short-subunit alcohol dehydrogenase family)